MCDVIICIRRTVLPVSSPPSQPPTHFCDLAFQALCPLARPPSPTRPIPGPTVPSTSRIYLIIVADPGCSSRRDIPHANKRLKTGDHADSRHKSSPPIVPRLSRLLSRNGNGQADGLAELYDQIRRSVFYSSAERERERGGRQTFPRFEII